MPGGNGFAVSPARVAAHAAIVDGIAARVEQARAATTHVQLGRAAYGQLCQFLPALFDGVQDDIVNAHQTCRDAVMNTGDRLRTAGGEYRSGDRNVAADFGDGR